ncbi:MAG: carbohydrate-binding family 9-like protein, partial [Clostridia bacterium]
MPRYEIQRISHQIQPDSSTSPFSGGTDWDSAPWNSAEALRISYFHPDSKSTYPQTFCKALYDDSFLYWTFSVKDRWVRAQYLEYQDPVCRDSCVEFFVQPIPEAGYFNFEVNCIGTLQLFYIEDPTRTETGFKKATPISVADASGIQI